MLEMTLELIMGLGGVKILEIALDLYIVNMKGSLLYARGTET